MIVIDTSALIAILNQEPERAAFYEAIVAADRCLVTAEMRRITNDPAYVDGVLRDGARRAREIALPNMDAVKDIVGFLR